MLAPHYKEIIDAVNRMNRGLTLYDGHGYLGQDVYRLTFTVDGKVSHCEYAVIAVHNDGIQLCPTMGFGIGYKLDGRRKKKFKFEDYTFIEDLAADLGGYILDTVDNYKRNSNLVNALLRKQDRKITRILMKKASL
jgi:hypothetical protein